MNATRRHVALVALAAVSVGSVASACSAAGPAPSVSSVSAGPTATSSPVAAPVRYLYAARSQAVSVATIDGATGTLTVTGPVDVLRFTDRPKHEAADVTPAVMLTDFGWTTNGDSLGSGKHAPNAAVTIDGAPTQAVEIQSADVGADGTLTLRVTPLGTALTAASGPGSVFIDATSGTVTTWLTPNSRMVVSYSGAFAIVSWQVEPTENTYAQSGLSSTEPTAKLSSSLVGSDAVYLNAGASVDFVSTSTGEVTFTGTIVDSGQTYSFNSLVVGTYAQAS